MCVCLSVHLLCCQWSAICRFSWAEPFVGIVKVILVNEARKALGIFSDFQSYIMNAVVWDRDTTRDSVYSPGSKS